ncbi:MAG: hypothetical protein NT173_02620 [Opitutales bacterium]|nr:hypothetical protein [Opitutales bacterium]
MTSNPHRILIGVLSLNFGWLTGSAQTAALGSASAANTPATVATAPATTELTAALPQAVSAADQVAAGSAFVIAQAGEAFAIVSAAEQGDRSQAGRLASLVATIRADVRVPEYEEIRIH